MATQRFATSHEWRDAIPVGPDGPDVLDLGPIPDSGVLRIGVNAGDGGGFLNIFAGDRLVRTIALNTDGEWQDLRVPLDSYVGETAGLVVDAPRTVQLAPCELISAESIGNRATPNVLVVLIDTLRQDHMSTYGYSRNTTPVLDELAKEATVLSGLMPSSSWTRPSVASLMTSMDPSVHGAEDAFAKLRDGLPSLARALGENGYETHGLMTNTNCLPTWGFGGDFFRFVDVDSILKNLVRNDPAAIDAAIATLDHAQGRPWFLYLHLIGPHRLYNPPEEYRSMYTSEVDPSDPIARDVAQNVDLYDAEIAHTDFQLGRLLRHLRETHRLDDTLVVVLSDHGEEFQEHGGWEHGKTLFEEMLRVPLIMKPPLGQWPAPARIDDLVGMIDVAPTVLDALSIPPPTRFQGRSFLPLLAGEQQPPRTGFASLHLDWASARTAKNGTHKYIRDLAAESEHWFDLAADPREQQPLTEPGVWGDALRGIADTRAVQGKAGLHLLVIGAETQRSVVVELTAAGLGEAAAESFKWNYDSRRDGETLTWSLTEETVYPLYQASSPHGAAERLHAHLNVPIDPAAKLGVSVAVDGAPASSGLVRAGNSHATWVPSAALVEVADLIGNPDQFDLATLPDEFAVYLWYVPATTTLDESEVSPDMIEALKAVGYLN